MRPLTPLSIGFPQQLAFGHLIAECHEAPVPRRTGRRRPFPGTLSHGETPDGVREGVSTGSSLCTRWPAGSRCSGSCTSCARPACTTCCSPPESRREVLVHATLL